MLHLENFFEKSFALLLTTPIFKIILKKCLTNASDCDILDELSLRRQRKNTKNLDN